MATIVQPPNNWTAGVLNGRNPYGSIGSKLSNVYGSGQAGNYAQPGMMNNLPDWLRSQYSFDGGQGEDSRGQWVHNGRGTITDKSGKSIYQVGYDDGDENVIDRDKVWYDPELGLVTDPGNIKQVDRIGTKDILGSLAFVFGGPMALEALGAGGVGAAAGGAGEGMSLEAMLESLGAGNSMYAAPGAAEAMNAGLMAELGGAGAGAGGIFSGLGNIPGLEQLGSLIKSNPLKALSLASSLFGGGGSSGRPGGGGGMNINDLLNLAMGGGQYAQQRSNLGDFRSDINNMVNVGTAGVTNDDRAGARNLVKGVYDGSISGDEVFNRVPGLRALSDRGAEDIARRWSRSGESGVNDPHAMRDWVGYNNELTSKAWNSEMDRASRIGGFDFNPAGMAGRGLDALGQYYGGMNKNDNQLWALLGSMLNGGGSGGGGGDGGNIWDVLGGLFGGGGGDDGGDGFLGEGPSWYDTAGETINV